MAEKETPVPAAKQSERKELQTLNKRNYQKELDKLIENIQKEEKTPRLFLHACCAPCSSYVMEYLSQYFEITIFFYNPNIAPEEEYAHRVAEIRRLIGEMEFVHPVTLVEGPPATPWADMPPTCRTNGTTRELSLLLPPFHPLSIHRSSRWL